MITSIIFKAAYLFFYKITTHFNTLPPTLHYFFKSALKKIGLPLHVLSLKSAYPSSPSLNRLTQRLTVLTSTH